MRETQRNIRNYQKRLVGVKEKLATAGLLFLMSAVMLTTASFAWITLSVAPEVANISTTIVGNGNLEIALASSDEDGNLKFPEESKVGDSNLPIVEKNLTWGNLVNLNDASYGLNNIVLRPSMLRDSDLKQSPLKSFDYSADGRVNAENWGFMYSNYDKNANAGEGAFVVGDPMYGVRAISSVQYKDLSAAEDLLEIGKIRTKLTESIKAYQAITDAKTESGNKYMTAISKMIGVYLTDKFNDGDENYSSYINTILELFEAFDGCLDSMGNVYAEAFNYQLKKAGSTKAYTWEQLLSPEVTEVSLKSEGITYLNGFAQLKSDKINLQTHWDTVKALKGKSSVLWSDLSEAVNFMVVIEECIVDGQHKVKNIGKQIALELYQSGAEHYGVITQGVLKNYEDISGFYMYAEDLPIQAKYIISITLEADVYTQARIEKNEHLPTLINSLESLSAGNKESAVAAEVYGMALDFFLRTNADNSYLTLEGEVVSKLKVQKTATGYYCYMSDDGVFYHIPPEGISVPEVEYVDNVKLTDKSHFSGGEFYNLSTGQRIMFVNPETGEEDGTGRDEFIETLNEYSVEKVIVGYDGVNRIWEEGVPNPDQSTSQGKGSCYIFYPKDSLEQEKMLELLSALRIAFIDETGNKLAEAELNVKEAYEEVGKVTVPLVLMSDSDKIITEDGETIPVITPLSKGVEQYISAIVYINGESVTNADVSESSNIEGFLNLQFGSTADLQNRNDEDLKYEEYTVYASMTPNGDMTYDPVNLPSALLEVTIVGATPKEKVSVKTIRKLNEYQGAVSDEEIVLTRSGDGNTWTANAEFNRPGTYIVRSVWIDGQEYEISNSNIVSIVVEGFHIENVSWKQLNPSIDLDKQVYKMTSEQIYSVGVDVAFRQSDTYKPEKVQGLFRNDYNEYVYVNFKDNGNSSWSGNATFTTSGTYVFESLLINDEVYSVPESLQKTLTIYVSINGSVKLQDITEFEYEGNDIEINVDSVYLYDDKKNKLSNLSNVTLYYLLEGGSLGNVDDVEIAELKWDSTQQKYIGRMLFESPGVYKVAGIMIDSNYITNITGAQDVMIITKDPTHYVVGSGSAMTSDYQFKPSNDASFSLQLENSPTAMVVAELINSNNPTVSHYVTGTKGTSVGNITEWHFAIPDMDPTADLLEQSGEWTLKKLYLTRVADDEGNWYSPNSSSEDYVWYMDSSACIIWDMEEDYQESLVTYVANDIFVSMTDTNNTVLSTATVFTESIKSPYSIQGYTLIITDNQGNTLNSDYIEIATNSISLKYDLNMSEYKWWENASSFVTSLDTSTYLANDYITRSFTTADSKEYSAGSVEIKYPGDYTPTVTFTINDKTYGMGIVATATAPQVYRTDAGASVDFVRVVNKNSAYQFIDIEKVVWSQPAVNWKSVSPSTSTTLFFNASSYNAGSTCSPDYRIKANSSAQNNLSTATNNVDVYIYMTTDTAGTQLWTSGYEKSVGSLYSSSDASAVVPSKATAQIVNIGNDITSATCVIDNLNSGNNYKDVTMTFTGENDTDEQSIGVGSTQDGHKHYEVKSGSSATNITAVYADQNYILTIKRPLTVNAGNDTGW